MRKFIETNRTSIIVVLTYFIFTAVWIYGSDKLLGLFVQEMDIYARVQTIKSFIYLFISSAFIWKLVKNEFMRFDEMYKLSVETSTKFENYFRHGNTGVVVLDEMYEVIELNEKAKSIFNCTEDDVLQLGIVDMLKYFGVRDIVEETLLQLSSNGREELLELNTYSDINYVHLSASTIRDENAEILYYICYFQDVDNQKQVELELLEKGDQLELKVEELGVANRTLHEEIDLKKKNEKELLEKGNLLELKIEATEKVNKSLHYEIDLKKKMERELLEKGNLLKLKIEETEKANKSLHEEIDLKKKTEKELLEKGNLLELKIEETEKANKSLHEEIDLKKKTEKELLEKGKLLELKIEETEKANKSLYEEIDLMGEDITELKLSEKQMIQLVEARAKVLEAVAEVGKSLIMVEQIENVYDSLHDSIIKLTGAEHFYIVLAEFDLEVLNFVYDTRQEYGAVDNRRAMSNGLVEYVIENKETLYLHDDLHTKTAALGIDIHQSSNISSWLGIPLFEKGNVIGAICVQHSQNQRVFSSEQINGLETIASEIAIYIAKASLYKEIQTDKMYIESLVNVSPVAIITTDKKNEIVLWNPAAESLFGYGKDEVLGRNIDDLISLSDRSPHGEAISIIGKSAHQYDGPKEVEVVTAPISVNGESLGLVVMYNDISELLKARKEAELAYKHQEDILDNMSHEIRTPMNAIIDFSELDTMMDLSDQQLDYVSKIQTSSKTLLDIINDVLDVSEIEADKLELEKTASAGLLDNSNNERLTTEEKRFNEDNSHVPVVESKTSDQGVLETQNASVSKIELDGYTVDGLNLDIAVERMGGDLESYIHLINGFTSGPSEMVSEMADALRYSDLKLLREATHKLKGVMENMGADDLYHSILRFENAIESTTIEALRTDFIVIQLSIEHLKMNIRNSGIVVELERILHSNTGVYEYSDEIMKLKDLISNRESESAALAKDFAKRIQGTIDQSIIDVFIDEIKKSEFENALAHLDWIESILIDLKKEV